MADWIKVRHALVRSPKLLLLARELKCNRYMALGFAITWLVWLDEQTQRGETGLSAGEIDDMLGIRGLAAGLERIGWISRGGDGTMFAVEFDKYSGAGAKERALTARRVAECKKRKGNGTGVTVVTGDALPEENRIEYIDMAVAGNATADKGGGRVACPPPDGFPEWWERIKMAHPSCSKSKTLALDVYEHAVEAFERCPQAVESVELLAAYMADRMQEDRYRKAFYRPTGQAKFFQNLEDVLCHAERWAREKGWKPKAAGKKPVEAPAKPAARVATPAEQDAFLRALKEGRVYEG